VPTGTLSATAAAAAVVTVVAAAAENEKNKNDAAATVVVTEEIHTFTSFRLHYILLTNLKSVTDKERLWFKNA
jgi:hypothetical protein